MGEYFQVAVENTISSRLATPVTRLLACGYGRGAEGSCEVLGLCFFFFLNSLRDLRAVSPMLTAGSSSPLRTGPSRGRNQEALWLCSEGTTRSFSPTERHMLSERENAQSRGSSPHCKQGAFISCIYPHIRCSCGHAPQESPALAPTAPGWI